jgi:iron complex outermembrane receptor protein
MPLPSRPLSLAVSAVLALSLSAGSVRAEDAPADKVSLGTIGTSLGSIDVMVARDSIEALAPIQANLAAIEPQTVISRTFIEDQVPVTGNFNSIIGIAPSMATTPSPNGPGLTDTSTTMRGFKDNQYNVTWDGIPFGDTNDPSHHSTSYFPSSVIGGVVIERGPGNASNMGQATFGGSVNLFSKTPSEKRSVEVYASYGSWNTNLDGISFESGRLADDSTLQFNYQKLQSHGYLEYNTINSDNGLAKYTKKFGESTKLTLFAQYNDEFLHLPDNWVGPTAPGADGPGTGQVTAYGIGYGGLNNNPLSQAYYQYNHIRKSTDMEYARIESNLGGGWSIDNNLYTYAYKNYTVAGANPDEADPALLAPCGTLDGGVALEPTVCSGHKGSPAGDVPGNDKLNQYRVQGDIFKATYETSAGLLRFGAWLEASHTHRHKYYMDLTTNTFTGKIKNDQGSSWTNYQPFAEFEWKATDTLTVTPGVKYVHFDRRLDAIQNNGNGPFNGDYIFTKTLPFLTVNQRLSAENSVYLQFAQGMQIPTLDYTYFPVPAGTTSPPGATPQTTTNYQIGFVHKDARLTWDVDAYLIDFKNLQLTEPGSGGVTNFVSAGGARYEGLEGEIAYLIGGGLSVFANAALNSAKFVGINDALIATDQGQGGVSSAFTYNGGAPTNGSLPYTPDSTLALGLVYHEGPVNATINYVRTGSQYAVPGENGANDPSSPNYIGYQNKIPAYDNVDVNASYTFTNVGGLQSLKLGVSVYNVMDRRNLTLITTGPTELNFQAPRSYMVTVKAKF